MNKEDNQLYKVKPRKLGEEWENWTGQIEENLGDMSTKPYLFLNLLFFTIFLLLAFFAAIYFILNNFFITYSSAHLVLSWGIISISVICVTYFLLIVATFKFKKPYAFFLKDKQLANLLLAKIVIMVGMKIGIPQDKLLNSLLNFNNALTAILYKSIKKEDLLILVPRCLSKEIRGELHVLMEKYDLDIHIATGGTQAREILKETKPKGIIAVACERDLYAGVKDAPSQIPIIAIANKRPNGPCKDTLINSTEFEEAIKLLINPKKINKS